ncbi:MAG: hypothetical protein ACKVS8_03685 [Phycisphaerales bacterium]
MTDSLRRACLLRGSTAATTPTLALAAAIGAVAAGVAEAQAQTPPRGNVRVILRCNDLLAGTPDTSGYAFPRSARIADDGTIEAVIAEQRYAAVSRVDDQLIDFQIGPFPVPGVSDNAPFYSEIGVSGRAGALRIDYERGGVLDGQTLLHPTESWLGPLAGGARIFTDGTVRPLAFISSIVFWFDRSLWMKDKNDAFVCVARKGDPAPGYEAQGLVFDELWSGSISPSGAASFSATLLRPDGAPADPTGAIWTGRPGAFVPVFESPGPIIPGFETLRLWSGQGQLLTSSGKLILSVLYTDPADDPCCVEAFLSTILVFQSGSFQPLVPPAQPLPGGPGSRLPSYLNAQGETRDGSIVFSASYSATPGLEETAGLWLTKNSVITPIRVPTDPDLPVIGTFGGIGLLGETETGDLYYTIMAQAHWSDPRTTIVESWTGGTRRVIFSTAEPIPGHDSRCSLAVQDIALDPRGGILLRLKPDCYSFQWMNPTAPLLTPGLYRVHSPGAAPELILPPQFLVSLPTGTTRAMSSSYALGTPSVNRFGQTLINAFDLTSGDRYVVLLETTALCREDYNADGVLDPDDIGDYITAFFGPGPSLRTDVDEDGVVTTNDLGDYITNYFAGCPE